MTTKGISAKLGVIHLRDYISLRNSVYAEFKNRCDNLLFTNNCRKGNFEVAGDVWEYFRHGAGSNFKNVHSGIVIDVEKEMRFRNQLCANELAVYFGSMRQKGVKIVSKAIGRRGVTLYEGAAEWLVLLEQEKLVRKVELSEYPFSIYVLSELL